jgi:uncharacterized membrane protein
MNARAAATKTTQPLIRSGLVLGFGLGGFFDGIVLHQLLQWHHLVSNLVPMDTLPGLELNTLWDGIFHILMYGITALGLVLMWRAIQNPATDQSPRLMLGAVLVGWGIFHIFDSVVNHWLLQVHHIRPGQDELAYDIGYFIIGLVLIFIGWRLALRGAAQSRTR